MGLVESGDFARAKSPLSYIYICIYPSEEDIVPFVKVYVTKAMLYGDTS